MYVYEVFLCDSVFVMVRSGSVIGPIKTVMHFFLILF